jgi:hypothetical protein
MIKISLDEAYVFDLLSILDLKKDKSKNTELYNIHLENYYSLYLDILNQIGIEELSKILNSEEYKELKHANMRVFDLVDLCLKDEGLAGETARENHKRFILKNKLQKKFFKNNLKEAKI